LDYSFARPEPAAIHAAGYRFAGRYLDPGSKGITRTEADRLAAAGIWVIVTYETTAEWMLGGYSAGQAAARTAQALGRAAGMPAGRPVYFAADFDATASQVPAVLACLDGCASVLGRGAAGVYGGLAVVRAALNAGTVWAWQTLAWSGGQWDPRARVRQVRVNTLLSGSAVDVNEAMTADYGQWQPGKVPSEAAPDPAASPAPATIPGDLMLLNKGAGAVTPLAIPDTAKSLRFLAAGTAELSVTFHGSPAQTLALSWAGGSHSLTPPKDVYAVLVTRTDAGTGDVCVVAQ
jgi:hypothetical protein